MELTLIFLPILAAFFVSLLVKRRSAMEYATVAASLVVFVESVSVAIRVSANGPLTLAPIFSIDALGAILMSTIALVGLFVSFYSVFYLRREMDKGIIGFSRVRQYYMLMNLFLGAMLLAATSSNPILTWISIEATTLSTAFLISFYNKPEAMEAAWKYLIVNSVGLLLGFFGTLLYFTSLKTGAGAAVFTTWDSLLSNATHLDPVVAKAAFVFVLIGYGTKVGLVPMHTWLPDAHSKAPMPISALLSGVLLNVAFIALLRFKAITDIAVGLDYSQKLLIVFGFLSICVA
ncbi:MAG: proton-conducting transporter membrane subunit, partial [Patescibacteria group bacterium]